MTQPSQEEIVKISDTVGEIYDRYEPRLVEIVRDLQNECDNVTVLNALMFSVCALMVSSTMARSGAMGRPISATRLCVGIAQIVNRDGYYFQGELVIPPDDCEAQIVEHKPESSEIN
jgi:hypothetical protein